MFLVYRRGARQPEGGRDAVSVKVRIHIQTRVSARGLTPSAVPSYGGFTPPLHPCSAGLSHLCVSRPNFPEHEREADCGHLCLGSRLSVQRIHAGHRRHCRNLPLPPG